MRHFCSSATTVWCLHLFSRLSASTLSSNTAVVSGGGIYVANSQVTSTTNVIQDNRVVGSTIRQVSWATALGLGRIFWTDVLSCCRGCALQVIGGGGIACFGTREVVLTDTNLLGNSVKQLWLTATDAETELGGGMCVPLCLLCVALCAVLALSHCCAFMQLRKRLRSVVGWGHDLDKQRRHGRWHRYGGLSQSNPTRQYVS